jgi:CheY-like chemotaxis protein
MSQLKILLVDDEPDIREILKDILSIKGHSVLEAADAKEGLKILNTKEVDVIFSDMNMPGMSGLDFFKEAKLIPLAKNTKRFLVTGDLDPTEKLSPEDKANSLIHGFINKPFNDEQLDTAILSLKK